MRIGIVCPNYPPATFEGGISHYSRLLAEGLAERGHEVAVFVSKEYALPKSIDNTACGINRIWVDKPWNGSAVARIRRIASQIGMEAVILQYAPAIYCKAFRLHWAITRFPCQKVVAFHSLWGKDVDRFLGLMMLFSASKIIATNSEIRSIINRRLPVLRTKTYWIPIGSSISVHPFEPDAPESTPLIAHFGMLYPGKGTDLILDTLVELAHRRESYTFRFVGGEIIYYQGFRKRLERDIRKRGLQEMVAVTGYIPEKEVSWWLQKCRFLFMPYESGLSDRRSSFIAALLHGKPVLTKSPVVAMPLFKNRISVIWPNITTSKAFADCAQELLHNDDLVRSIGQGARSASRHFNWKRIAKEYDHVLLQ